MLLGAGTYYRTGRVATHALRARDARAVTTTPLQRTRGDGNETFSVPRQYRTFRQVPG